MIKLFSSSITKYMQIRTGNHLDALRWTMNFYHNVTDSVSYSYSCWKKSYFVSDIRYPIQNNPTQVIYLCLLGSAIMTCSEFFKNLGVKASWHNIAWKTALDTLSSNDTERRKAVPNVDTYLTISHSYRMELGTSQTTGKEKQVMEGLLGHLGFKSRNRHSSEPSVLDHDTIGLKEQTGDPRRSLRDDDKLHKRYIIELIGWKDEQPEDELPGKIHVTLIQNLIVRTVAF